MTLGTTNTTKDVPNSWFFLVTIADETITVQNKKREQAVDGIFQFEWALSFTFERQHMECTTIKLQITELNWNPAVTPEKMEEVTQILSKYASPCDRAVDLTYVCAGIWCPMRTRRRRSRRRTMPISRCSPERSSCTKTKTLPTCTPWVRQMAPCSSPTSAWCLNLSTRYTPPIPHRSDVLFFPFTENASC